MKAAHGSSARGAAAVSAKLQRLCWLTIEFPPAAHLHLRTSTAQVPGERGRSPLPLSSDATGRRTLAAAATFACRLMDRRKREKWKQRFSFYPPLTGSRAQTDKMIVLLLVFLSIGENVQKRQRTLLCVGARMLGRFLGESRARELRSLFGSVGTLASSGDSDFSSAGAERTTQTWRLTTSSESVQLD